MIAGAVKMVGLLAKRAFPRRLASHGGEYSNVGRESGKGKTTPLQAASAAFEALASGCLQVPSFPRARPRMYRHGRDSEVWVAALNLIEAHSHTLMQFLGGSNFRDGTRVPAGNLGGKTK